MGGQRQTPATLHPGKGPGTNCTGGRVGLRVADEKNVARTGIRCLARSARSESPFRLSYGGVIVENRYSLWESYEACNYAVWEKYRVSESYGRSVAVATGLYSLKHRHNWNTTFTLIWIAGNNNFQ